MLLIVFSFLSCSLFAQYDSEKNFDSSKNNLFFFVDDIKGPWMGYYDILKTYDTLLTGYIFHYVFQAFWTPVVSGAPSIAKHFTNVQKIMPIH